ncbi:MAG TPA: gephyrin-like molybdotransferase Glp [Streptosporangiaceae bacterium]|nr:gephyrin-like molybdotransferase Glp [Streptosporangiaceae bacterium]
MDSIEAYLADIMAAIRPLPPRELTLADALGAVLVDDVTARWPLPSFDNSAMDGYAVRAADVTTASDDNPVMLAVDGEVAAGDTGLRSLVPGTVIRIMTGAPLPAGADAVVPVERTDGGTDRVAIRTAVAEGASVRMTGGDARAGDVLLTAGTRLGAVHLGLLAAAGHGTVTARPRPRVTVISTGNELVEPGTALIPGQIWESNATMLAAAAREAGCPARRYPIVRDDTGAVLAAVQDALADADVLITSGGVSMGAEHDVVKAALTTLGTVTFRQVAMQPGMPQGFGTVGPAGTPIFTLPGNPVSAYVSFCLFVWPALDALQDSVPERGKPAQAVLTQAVRSPAAKRSFLRGILDGPAGLVTPVSGQMSHQLASLAKANALVIVPEQVTSLDAGATVDVLELP